DFQTGQLREVVDDAFAEAVRKVIHVWISTLIREGENCDRRERLRTLAEECEVRDRRETDKHECCNNDRSKLVSPDLPNHVFCARNSGGGSRFAGWSCGRSLGRSRTDCRSAT